MKLLALLILLTATSCSRSGDLTVLIRESKQEAKVYCNRLKNSLPDYCDTEAERAFILDTIFTESVVTSAIVHQKLHGIPASLKLAQMFIESKRYGELALNDLSRYNNNYFGIKARKGEKFVLYDTPEVINNKNVRVVDKFAVYESRWYSMKAHTDLMLRLYKPTNGNDVDAWLSSMQDGRLKYATSDKYKVLVKKVMVDYGLIFLI